MDQYTADLKAAVAAAANVENTATRTAESLAAKLVFHERRTDEAQLVILALLLVACGRIVYRHANYTPQLWSRDSYECERDARQSGYFGTGIVGQLNMRDFYDRCLAARGWVKTTESN